MLLIPVTILMHPWYMFNSLSVHDCMWFMFDIQVEDTEMGSVAVHDNAADIIESG